MKRSSLLVLSAVVLAVSASWLYAGPPKEWKQAEWKVPKQQFNIITAVNASAGTVSISHQGGKDRQDRDLKTSAFTEIVVDGKRTTLAALTAGMHVTYTLGGDGDTVAHIENVAEQAPPPTPVATATPSFPSNYKKP